jgi:hypothetical protein
VNDLNVSQIDGLTKEGELIFLEYDFDPVIAPCTDEKLLNGEFFGECPPLNSPSSVSTSNQNQVINITESKSYDVIDIRSGHDLLIDSSGNEGANILLKANSIETQNATIEIRLNKNNVVIVTDNFRPSGKGNNPGIIIKDVSSDGSGGNVLIYALNYENNGNCSFDFDANCYLNVYIFTGGILDIRGTPNFYGSIYAPDATSVLTGNSQVVGWIIANEAKGQGGIYIQFSPVQTLDTGMSLDFYRIRQWTNPYIQVLN